METKEQMKTDNSRTLTPEERRTFRNLNVKAKRRKKRVITWVLILVFLALACVPGYRFLYQPFQASSTYRYAKTLYTQAGSGIIPAYYNQEFGALYDLNSDIGGWLIIPGSEVTLPVVSTTSHNSVYYVNHLIDGKSNPYGTPYYLSGLVTETDLPRIHTVINGSNGLMGELEGYRTLEFYQQAPLIFMDTIGEASIYKIFAVVDVTEDEVSRFSQVSFTDVVMFEDFVNEMATRSYIKTDITVNGNDRLLTVMVDTAEGRLAIIGRATREDENYAVDTSTATAHQPNSSVWVFTPTDVSVTDAVTPKKSAAKSEQGE